MCRFSELNFFPCSSKRNTLHPGPVLPPTRVMEPHCCNAVKNRNSKLHLQIGLWVKSREGLQFKNGNFLDQILLMQRGAFVTRWLCWSRTKKLFVLIFDAHNFFKTKWDICHLGTVMPPSGWWLPIECHSLKNARLENVNNHILFLLRIEPGTFEGRITEPAGTKMN